MATSDEPRRPTSSAPLPGRVGRRALRSRISPLAATVTALVVVVGAALIALLLAPLVAGFGFGVNRVSERMEFLGDCRRISTFPQRSVVFAADGKTELATLFADYDREVVPLREVSTTAREAVLAIEDDGFYQHGALNFPSLVRALVADLAQRQLVQGGSTITQQLVKNAVLANTSQTVQRKLREAAVANCLERKYTKDEIFELYLNDVYFGNGVYGIGTAADFYFHEPASRLTLAQGALLAGLIQSPETYDPLRHPKAAIRRRDEVLDRLSSLGWIPRGKAEAVGESGLDLAKHVGVERSKEPSYPARYITGQILDVRNHEFDALGTTERDRLHSLYQGGLRIYSTFDPTWQGYAQEAANAPWAVAPSNPGYGQVPDVALASVDTSTGAIRTLLSGRNYDKDHLGLVTAARQPGSSFKPFTLVAAFEQGVPPGTAFSSRSPFHTSLWDNSCHCVSNAEGAGDRGYLDLWRATADSVNVVFAQLELSLRGGGEAVAAAARQAGIETPLSGVPSITLGTEEVSPLDMASAYQTLADEGVHCAPFAVARVTTAEGETLYRHKPNCHQAIPADVARLVTAMLEGVIRDGTGSAAGLGRPAAGKTGTTQDYSNAWFVGYTPQLSTAVWVGFPNSTDSMEAYFGQSVFGGTVAAPIWRAYMARATTGMPVQSFPPPPAPQSGKVPRVVGVTSGQAQRRLAASRFTPLVETIWSSRRRNEVIEQRPDAGTEARLGSIVTIYVSKGRAPARVPDVLGFTPARAMRVLEDAGFAVSVDKRPVSAPRKVGRILQQSPAAGEKIARGSVVTILVGAKK